MPSTPQAPDTPAVSLSTLLADPGLGLEQIAGPREDRLVGTIGTTELEDPAPYLRGGELLLIAGVRLPRTDEAVDAYVRRLVEAGIAALGFGVAPVHDEVPPALRSACDRHGLPLLRIPPGTPFVAVNHAAHQAMAQARHRELREVAEAQAALATAAARPDPLKAVLHRLASHLGAWAVLLDPYGQELLAAGTRPAEPAVEQLRALATETMTRVRWGMSGGRAQPPTAAAEHQADVHLTVHTLPAETAGTTDGVFALGIAADRPPTAVHRSVTGTALVLLSLLTTPRHALGTDTRSAAALVRLMLGHDPVEVAPLLASAARTTDTWTVIHGRLTTSHAGPASRPGADPAQLAALGTALNTPYLDVDGIRLRGLLPAGAALPDLAPVARLGWTLGLSAPVAAADLVIADRQADRMLRHAVAAGAPWALHREQELSLHSLVGADDAVALARARFAPLADAPAPGPAVLLETLRTWLAQHGNWDRTAAALELHRNTVRRRIARTAELLDVDLDDLDVRMELWFALRWLPGERLGRGEGEDD
ncbi:PucR family transcriptional regulator [Streptomyces cylindrosporus]|uniref:PucR family transcriptional regulator n=1 Tax=Streptomyces cylindrosporus TaxID=2927583 RepID=A0ABS9Y9P4_9ACTN|nr:PucR family transcriptional regulator [Streptomyces cylindrosporus]MCI3273947.1 PucR family transcriptional regulator [Streptomyces cylindrosporus]